MERQFLGEDQDRALSRADRLAAIGYGGDTRGDLLRGSDIASGEAGGLGQTATDMLGNVLSRDRSAPRAAPSAASSPEPVRMWGGVEPISVASPPSPTRPVLQQIGRQGLTGEFSPFLRREVPIPRLGQDPNLRSPGQRLVRSRAGRG
jgi:hypothetical protein